MAADGALEQAASIDPSALLEQLPEMIMVIADDLTITYANQRLYDVMGYERGAVVGTNIFDYVHPDDALYMANTWEQRAAHPGEPGILIEARGRNADGTWRAVEIFGLSLLDDPGVRGMVMTLRDLTRKPNRGDVAGRVRAMLDRTTDVVLALDADGRVGYANRRLSSHYGVDQQEFVGVPFAQLLPHEERARFHVVRWAHRRGRSARRPDPPRRPARRGLPAPHRRVARHEPTRRPVDRRRDPERSRRDGHGRRRAAAPAPDR